MAVYIYQKKDWPKFWDDKIISPLLASLRYRQGILLGKMSGFGFKQQREATLDVLTLEVIKSSEIEGEVLDAEQVRSSIARRLGMDIAGLIPSDRNVDGVVDMMMDAIEKFDQPLTDERLFGWHAALFPTGYSGIHKIVVAGWRDNADADPMQVVSGASGREVVHFQAPDSSVLEKEMKLFLDWFNSNEENDPILKAAIAHLWFVTIHPFDDGNGRIARAITDMLLAKADESAQRFYSMSAQIRIDRKEYYDVLEKTQKDSLDITDWLEWFLQCLDRALKATNETLKKVVQKAKFWDQFSTVSLNERQCLMLNRLMDGFEGKLNTSKWSKIAKCSQDTAARDIQDLITKGILIKDASGGRSTSYSLTSNED
ncbi:Fic family protein [Pinibacter aurantiacus]|uniref:Fic family protein n=1 Tax=Pinibacter aurantiacus TaxID=2851599 RepID=A0A9E2W3N9_9BACT|nr:Fic family protein [Pinibacter aurantiacus]MBV4356478.1 Fic family protein [Pinibacter aurantiacus]